MNLWYEIFSSLLEKCAEIGSLDNCTVLAECMSGIDREISPVAEFSSERITENIKSFNVAVRIS